MSQFLDSAWNWYFAIEWSKAGGSSFVAFVTGLNFALIGWEQFRDRVRWPKERCEEIISAKVSSISDSGIGEGALGVCKWLFTKASRFVVGVLNLVWWGTTAFALLGVFAGLYMLYADRFCCHDWILILPLFLYSGITLFTLLCFYLFAIAVIFGLKNYDKFAKNTDLSSEGLSDDVTKTVTRVKKRKEERSGQEVGPNPPTTLTNKNRSGNNYLCAFCDRKVTKVAVRCVHCGEYF